MNPVTVNTDHDIGSDAARKSARRAAALRRLRRAKIKRAVRGASSISRANVKLTRLASETIQLIEQRIRYWVNEGDEEHVKRLRAVRQRLITTYKD